MTFLRHCRKPYLARVKMVGKMVSTRKKSSEEDRDESLLLDDNDDKKRKDNSCGAVRKKKAGFNKSLTKSSNPGGCSGRSTKTTTSNKKQSISVVKQTGVDNMDEPSPSTSKNIDHDAIMAVLKSIQDNQKKQGDELHSLTNRIQTIENYDYNIDENDDYEDNPQVYDDGEDDIDNSMEPPPKKQKLDVNNNRFSSMAKRCKIQEPCDSKIDEVLAETVTDLFRNGMSEN